MAGKFSREKYMRLVRNLLAKAEDPAASEEEARALNEKAMDIMARYGIQIAMDAAAGRAEDPIADYEMPLNGSYLPDFSLMLSRIGDVLGLRMVRTMRRGASCVMHVFGPQSTIERVDVLFTSLVTQVVRDLARDQPNIRGRDLLRWRKDFIYGYTTAVCDRLAAIEERAAKAAAGSDNSTSTAVVLADRARLTEQRMRQVYPRLRQRSISRGWQVGGVEAGRAAGERADLGQPRTGGGRRALTAG